MKGTTTFTLTPTEDEVPEPDETLTLTGTLTVAGTVPGLTVAGTSPTVVGTTSLTLEDFTRATLAVSDSAGDEGEALTFTLTLSRAVPTAVTIAYATTDGTATLADADYTATTGNVNIRAGATTGTITVPTTLDPVVEPDETLTLTVQASGPHVEASETSVTGTIRNDDVAQVTISGSEGVEGEMLTVHGDALGPGVHGRGPGLYDPGRHGRHGGGLCRGDGDPDAPGQGHHGGRSRCPRCRTGWWKTMRPSWCR